MSLASWKAEYYPVPADAVPKEEALAHALRKWEGLDPKILADYGVYRIGSTLRDKDQEAQELSITVETCALCHHYYRSGRIVPCKGCPLLDPRDNLPCDEPDAEDVPEGSHLSPYHQFSMNGQPWAMIRLIKQAIAHQRRLKTASVE